MVVLYYIKWLNMCFFDLSKLVLCSSSSSSRFIQRITQTPLMHYMSRCAANRRVFNADMRLLMLSVGSRRNSGNEYPDDRTCDGERSMTKTCCDGVVARSADDSWLTARAALTARNVRCTHAGCDYDTALQIVLSDVQSIPAVGAQIDQRICQHGCRGQSPTDQSTSQWNPSL